MKIKVSYCDSLGTLGSQDEDCCLSKACCESHAIHLLLFDRRGRVTNTYICQAMLTLHKPLIHCNCHRPSKEWNVGMEVITKKKIIIQSCHDWVLVSLWDMGAEVLLRLFNQFIGIQGESVRALKSSPLLARKVSGKLSCFIKWSAKTWSSTS